MIQRVIPSLRYLLERFDFMFEVVPDVRVSLKEASERGKADGIPGFEALKIMRAERGAVDETQYMTIVESYERSDCPSPSDSGVKYGIKNWNPLAAGEREGFHGFLNDIQHAAQCGCDGCWGRMSGGIEAYQERKKG